MYSVVVVGAGMIGSSAAKWAAEIGGRGVALVGPNEPLHKASADTFGAWFDEGRMTRLFDRNVHWKVLAKESVARYRNIENRSGVRFYEEVGFVSLVDKHFKELESFHQEARNLHSEGLRCDFIDHKLGKTLFPYLNITEDIFGYFQPDNSGHISPRGLVQAQKNIATLNHCNVIEQSVRKIGKTENGFKIQLSNGDLLSSQKIILATGAYLNISNHLKPFLEEGEEVDLKLTTQNISYLRIPEKEAMRLKEMPSIVTTFNRGAINGTYILPPIKYPNGHYYLKLGHFSLGEDKFEGVITTAEEMTAWYRRETGNKTAVAELAGFLQSFVTDLEVEEVSGGCCVTAKTPTKDAPYIQEISKGLVIAAGGCGYAAKSCDEIGRIAAVLALEERWDSEIPEEAMQVKFRKISR